MLSIISSVSNLVLTLISNHTLMFFSGRILDAETEPRTPARKNLENPSPTLHPAVSRGARRKRGCDVSSAGDYDRCVARWRRCDVERGRGQRRGQARREGVPATDPTKQTRRVHLRRRLGLVQNVTTAKTKPGLNS